ncbi:protein of unknown function [Melghirimyces algeriensis]|uniref:IrrE N-terminal-like domain-containing protein n=2 Tax=Melghirimyces algeriensis TaxID=910412 RepID=A0A521C6I1_9BACL|nr:protein of unknown function [Melghirimyces algeriensis]
MFSDLRHRIHAYFTVFEESPYIVISKSLQKDLPLLRCVLAEELGHYYTSAGFGVPISHVLYRGRVKLSKDEHRALRWAARYLLPMDKLIQSIHEGMRCPELAEHFCVTEEMVHFRLQMIKVEAAS